MTKPILMAVDEDPREFATLERELLGRYASDYQVFAEPSATAAHRHRNLDVLGRAGTGRTRWTRAGTASQFGGRRFDPRLPL